MAGRCLEDLGLVPLGIKDVLDVASTADVGHEFVLRMSCSRVEREEETCDDDDSSGGKEEIEVKLLSNGRVIVNNSTKDVVVNPLSHVLSVIRMRIDDERTRETNRENVTHTIFRITIENWRVGGDLDRLVQKSELNFVCLDGFEEVPSPPNTLNHRTDAFLLALESLILEEKKLESSQRFFISDRCNEESMDLPQTALGGNAFVAATSCTISPRNVDEYRHTLSLASRIKSLKTDRTARKDVNFDDSTIEIFAPLSTELLLTESKRIQNGDSVDIGGGRDVESEKRYENIPAVDKRVVLFERQKIVPGRKTVYEEPIVSKRRRENWLKAAGPYRQHLFRNKTGLSTIIEISPEKPFKKRNITQLIDVGNQTFHETIADLRSVVDSFATSNEIGGGHDVGDECIATNGRDTTPPSPNEQDSAAVQTSNDSSSSSSPKCMWRKYVLDRARATAELLEFTDLESRLTTPDEEERTKRRRRRRRRSLYPEESNTSQIICSSLKSNLLIRLEEEKMRLVEELKSKNEELNEIKNDFQSLKSDLEQTICLLTNENAELLDNLSAEKARSTETESPNHRKTINDRQPRILKITDEKVRLENQTTTPEGEIAAVKKENIESTEKNEEFEDIKKCKSLRHELESDHECKVLTLTEKCEYLAAENEKLSTALIAKDKENDVLKEENKTLSDKVSTLDTANVDEKNDVEQLRSENKVLLAENMDLKTRLVKLTDESVRFSGNSTVALDNLNSIDESRWINESRSIKDAAAATSNASGKQSSTTESYLANRVAALQEENDRLSLLNERLSESKSSSSSSSCSQCARFKRLEKSRKPVALGIKELNDKLDRLRKKFERERTRIEALTSRESNASLDGSLINASFADTFNLSFAEEKMQQLNKELQTVREQYEEKCDECRKICYSDENVDDRKSSKKRASEIGTMIEEVQQSVNATKEEIAEMKKKIEKYETAKKALSEKIDELEIDNKELREKLSERSLAAATERAKTPVEKTKPPDDESEQVQTEVEEGAMLRTKDLESSVEEPQGRISEPENEKAVPKNGSQKLEVRPDESKDVAGGTRESESSANQFDDCTTESEIKSIESVEGNDDSTRRRVVVTHGREKIDETNEELNAVKRSMIYELKLIDYDVNTEDVLNKTACETFVILLHAVVSKQKEVVDKFEKEKQTLEEEKQQSGNAERRAMLWVKELETENDHLQTNLVEKESRCKEQRSKLSELDRLYRESENEKNALKTKVQALELEIGNLREELDESRIREPEKEKMDELIDAIETLTTKNMELQSNIEGLEANEKQLKNVIEENFLDLKKSNRTAERVNRYLNQIVERYREFFNELKWTGSKIAAITKLLENKCDVESEYKLRLETVTAEYNKVVQNQAKERRETIERYEEEMAKSTMEKNKEIEMVKDKLRSENTKNTDLTRQLDESNKKIIALKEELKKSKEKYDELRVSSAKLEREVRNSMNKLKAEAALEELRDVNKRLRSHLDGASNRISELQENYNKILTQMVDLKAQYESVCQENAETKKTLSSHGSDKNLPRSSRREDGKHDDALVREKKEIARESTDKESSSSTPRRKDEEVGERGTEQIGKQLIATKAESNRTDRTVNESKERSEDLETENKGLEEGARAFESKSRLDREETETKTFYNENVLCRLKKECSDLQKKLGDYESKLKSGNRSNSSRSIGPSENERRRHSRNKAFDRQRDLENATISTDVDDEETGHVSREKILQLELELAWKNGQIEALQRQIQSENFAYEQKCRESQEETRALRKKNDELCTEVTKLERFINDVSGQDCQRCKQWRLNRTERACQTRDDGQTFFIHGTTGNRVNPTGQTFK